MPTHATKTLILMDVDTQKDFMLPGGALATIPNVARIIPNLQRVFDYAAERQMTTILATDAHTPDDPEFSTYGFPAHCVLGTPGYMRIPETDLTPTLVLESIPGSFEGSLPETERLIVKVHKQHFAVGANPNFANLMQALGPCHAIVTGVATQVCVKQSVQSLLGLGVQVSVVVDAVGPDVYEISGEAAIEELKLLGVNAVTTDEVCAGALEA